MTSEEMPSTTGVASTDERLRALAELVPGSIDATCLDPAFDVVALPASVLDFGFTTSGWAASGVSRPLDLVHTEDHAIVMGLIGRARVEGLASASIRFTDIDDRCRLHVIDLVSHIGVYLFVRGGELARVESAQRNPGRSRRLVLHRDASARLLWADENVTRVLGWSGDQLAAMTALDIVHPDDADRAVDSWLMMIAGGEAVPIRLRYRNASGEYCWFEATNTNHLADPERGFIQTELIDIDGEMMALARARDSELHFATLTESLPIGVLQVDGDGAVGFANDWMRSFTGLDSEALTDLGWIAPGDRDLFRSTIAEATQGGLHLECDVLGYGADGDARLCRVRTTSMPSTENNDGAIVLLEDVTAHRNFQRRLHLQALTDELTGMPNRRGLNDWLARHADEAGRDGLTIFFVDLDDFKLVNDVMGHAAGDEILIAVSKAIRETVRPDDHVARIGGDEFIVASLGVTERSIAQDLARRIVEAVAQPLVVNGESVWLGCSVGIASTIPDACNIERLISDADLAMYEAKRQGGAGLAFFEEEQRRGVEDRLRSENDLRTGLKEEHFELYLQPVFNLLSGAVESAEALVRWNHPQRGLVSPAEFIPTAERNGMIRELGAWILNEACRLSASWPDHPIAVNISPRQLAETGFVASVLSALERHRISPSAIVLEVTETVFLDTNAEVLQTLNELAAQGVRIALDDFGTGYSSLNHLRQIPAQILKVDHTYIAELGVNTGTTAIVEAVVGLTDRLGQKLIAEGIETEKQLAALVEMGVVLGQGYLLGHPVPAATFLASVSASERGERSVSMPERVATRRHAPDDRTAAGPHST